MVSSVLINAGKGTDKTTNKNACFILMRSHDASHSIHTSIGARSTAGVRGLAVTCGAASGVVFSMVLRTIIAQ